MPHVILFGNKLFCNLALLPRAQTSLWPHRCDLWCHKWPVVAYVVVSCPHEGAPSGRGRIQPASFACKLDTGSGDVCSQNSGMRATGESLSFSCKKDSENPLLHFMQSEGTPDVEEMNPAVKRSGWKPPKDTGLWGIADRVSEQVGCWPAVLAQASCSMLCHTKVPSD